MSRRRHIASLPPGVPYENQQVAALSLDNGILDLSEQEMRFLAVRIRDGLPAQ